MASVFATVVAAALACVVYWLADTLLPSIGIPMRWHTSGSSRIVLASTFDIVLTVVFAVVIGPAVEEIVFRGYVLTAVLQRWRSAVPAVLVAGLVFTSVHLWLGPGVVLFILVWSVLPSWLFIKYKSLYPAILFHPINNAIAYLAVPLWLK
jgi:membrane protease YdiL (CAAX protease family)